MTHTHEFRQNSGTNSGISVPVAGIHPQFLELGVDEFRHQYRHRGEFRHEFRQNSGRRC